MTKELAQEGLYLRVDAGTLGYELSNYERHQVTISDMDGLATLRGEANGEMVDIFGEQVPESLCIVVNMVCDAYEICFDDPDGDAAVTWESTNG